MDRRQLIIGVHVLVALGLVGVGAFRVNAGNIAGGAVSVVIAALVVALGFFVGRQQ